MKKALIYIGVLLIIMFVVTWQFVMTIPTAYAAKMMCTCHFVNGYDEEYIRKNDLNYYLIGLTKTFIEPSTKQARSTLLGLKPSVAVYRGEKLGCTLVRDSESAKLYNVKEEFHFNNSPDTMCIWPFKPTERSKLSESLQEVMDDVFSHEEINTRALLIIHRSEIIGERYSDIFDSSSLFVGWSIAKSITSTLVGVLVQQGLVDINAPVPVAEWRTDQTRSQITWRNLLQCNAGLQWSENYRWISDATRMLYLKEDTYAYAVSSRSEAQPGEKWVYSSGCANILSGLIRQTTVTDSAYIQFPYVDFAQPIGMKSLVMEIDGAGTYVGSSYANATARDWARFGLLYLNNGLCGETRIFPKWWSEFVSTPANGSNGIYGAQFWLNSSKQLPDVPRDMYYADGYQGQRIFIIPSKDLVVVRLGLSSDEQPDYNQLLADIISAIEESG